MPKERRRRRRTRRPRWLKSARRSRRLPSRRARRRPRAAPTHPAALKQNMDRYAEGTAGVFSATSADGETEVTLRLTPTGRFSRAAHRSSKERCRMVSSSLGGSAAMSRRRRQEQRVNVAKAYKLFDRGSDTDSGAVLEEYIGEYKPVEVWELSETIGSCRVVGGDGAADERPTSLHVALHCEGFNWKCSYATAPSIMRPSESSGAEWDALVESGQLVLCYTLRRDNADDPSALPVIELQMQADAMGGVEGIERRHARLRSMQAAFVRSYTGQESQ